MIAYGHWGQEGQVVLLVVSTAIMFYKQRVRQKTGANRFLGGVPRCGVGVPLPLVIVLSRREVGGVGSSAGQGGSSGHIGVATPKVGGPRVGGDRGGRAECSAIAGRKGARVVCQNRSRAGGMRAGVKLGHVPTAAAGTECAPKKRGGAAEGGEQSSRGKGR